jgi:hypothetical protein
MKLADVTFRKGTNAIAVPLDGLRLALGYPLIIDLRMPLAKSPQQLALSQDPRKLGVGLVSARFDKGNAN